MPAFAEDAGNVQELQRVIDVQQKQLESQQKELDEQRRLLQELQTQIRSLSREADKDEKTSTDKRAPAKPTSAPLKTQAQKSTGLSDMDKRDRDSPSGSNVTYFDPTKKINIPGTNTSVGLHGLVQFQMFHDSVGLDNNRFDTATIPVDGGPSQTKYSVNPTQIHLSSVTEVPGGQVNTMISFDFNGELDRPDPRLRIAYGEFVSDEWGLGVLGGQAYATMFDMGAVPETLDFAGPAGLWQQRQPLLRFTKSLSTRALLEVSLETPENVSYIGADTEELTRWPDFAIAGTLRTGSKSHVRLAGLARDLRAEVPDGPRDSAVGWVAGLSGKLGLPFLGTKDNFKFNLHYGDGYGTQIKGGPAEGVFDPATSELELIGIFGAYGGIQHFWSKRYRSNLVYGYVDADNPEFLPGDTLDSTNYAAADFIWAPDEHVTLGIEYLWGRRENKDRAYETSNRYLLSSKFLF